MSLYVLSECCQRLSLAAESEGASGLVLPHHESKSMYMYMCMYTIVLRLHVCVARSKCAPNVAYLIGMCDCPL